jgi:biopolymer transport protein ExbD
VLRFVRNPRAAVLPCATRIRSRRGRALASSAASILGVKNVWGLGAAVLSLLLLMVFWTVYVTGRLATTERLAPSETADGIEVPVIGTVGDFPEPEGRIVVNVTADGRIVVEGQEYSFDEFAAYIARHAAVARPTDATNLVLRADARLPWGAAGAVIVACDRLHPSTVLFAVRDETDGSEGAVGTSMAVIGDESPPEDDSGEKFVVRWVTVSAADGEGTPAALYDDIRQSTDAPAKLVARLIADDAVPFGTVCACYDALLRVGTVDVDFFGSSGRSVPGRDEFLSALGRAVAARGAHRMTIADGNELEYMRINGAKPVNADRHESHEIKPRAGAAAMPPVGRVRGATAGPTTPPRIVYID